VDVYGSEYERSVLAHLEADLTADRALARRTGRWQAELARTGRAAPDPSWAQLAGCLAIVTADAALLVLAAACVSQALTVLAFAALPLALAPFYWRDPRLVRCRFGTGVKGRR